MKEYLFTFTEVIRGSVKIESKVMPTEDEVIQAIMDGSAYYNNTEFEDIRLVESERKPAQKRRERDKRDSR